MAEKRTAHHWHIVRELLHSGTQLTQIPRDSGSLIRSFDIQGAVSDKRSRVFYILVNLHACKINKSQINKSNIMAIQCFFAYQPLVSNLSFII